MNSFDSVSKHDFVNKTSVHVLLNGPLRQHPHGAVDVSIKLHRLDNQLVNRRVHYVECLIPAYLKVETHGVLGIKALLVHEPGVIF